MDVNIIFKIAGIGILITFISILLKKADRDDIANLVAISGVIIVLIMVIDLVSKLFEAIRSLLL